jgi:hypothetical protein
MLYPAIFGKRDEFITNNVFYKPEPDLLGNTQALMAVGENWNIS